MAIWDICIRRPVFTTMLVLGPVVLGMASYGRLGVELFPNVDVPVVVVTTTLRGAGVEEMESSVTRPVEEAVNTVSGIDELRSTTKEGVSSVVIGFKLERNGDIAAQDVRDRISTLLPRLPYGTDAPVVEKFNLDAAPVVTVVVSGGPGRKLREVTEIAKKQIKEDLEGVTGVGSVVLVGGEQRAVNVTLRPERLRALSPPLSPEDVRRALAAQNIELPGGKVDGGAQERGLRVVGRIQTPADFENVIIETRTDENGLKYAVRVKDVADVTDDIEEPRGKSRLDGNVAVSLVIQKQSGGNTVAVADRVKERLAKIQSGLPADIKTEIIRDQSKFIKGSIEEVKFHLVLAAVLVIATIFIFLRDWRATLIAATAVPTSIVGTFAFMDVMGFSLNNMTLLGLILAVGIVIDDAVVVLENVFRYTEEYGLSGWDAASKATKEIALAVVATTLSLVVIFAPIAFMSGQVGRFFNSFGFVVAFAIMMSMAVSFTLTPMLCARLLRGPTPPAPLPEGKGEKEPSRADHEPGAHTASESDSPTPFREGTGVGSSHAHSSGWLTRWYVGTLAWSLRHRWVIVLATVITFLSTPVLFVLVGTDFVPKDDQSEFEVAITLKEGSTLATAEAQCAELEEKLKKVRGVTNVFTVIGPTDGRAPKGQGDVTQVNIYCRMSDISLRDFAQRDAMADARVVLADYPDLRTSVQDVKLISSSAFKNAQLDLSIRGPDGDKLDRYAAEIMKKMKANPKFTDVDTNAAARSPELQVRIDRQRAADQKVNVQGVATALSLLVGGEPVTKYKEGSDQYDVWLRAALPSRDRSATIDQLLVPDTKGQMVELRTLARLADERGPATIERYNRQRQIGVQCNFAPGVALGNVLPEVEGYVKELDLPPEYRYEFLGEAKLMADSNANFLLAFFLAFVFMYMILAAQFESLVHPITILMAVPLTLPFALISLMLLRTPLDIYAMIGLFMLFGIVKKNGILQVDYTNVLIAKGLPRDEAILRANEARFRPILMTTVMLVAAMIPIATGSGPGAGARASMAKVILGGQLLSLLLSLLVTPVAYSIWDDMMNRGKRVAAWIDRRRTRPAPAAIAMAEPVAEHAAAETVQEVPVFREAESDAAPTGS
ncbi:Multidrug resistance protein MdtC [Gemmata obscuriglobus]|uniref:efflux RND transporter permease subunit n=1 Tax=Gemmata obscuriglobus TaxID=114 RepID=UPI00016C5098|nr:efflux RND transporter permease subunit [Gemmata obscuriglobus]QEG25697.1 Multidrug resistance protein MdtC [Gemmata obscuriglobus]VTR99369.1 rnd transporter : Acriflavin resistance protein OS=Planctomyces limnophilus (strain ATCC 43296 / DSM 3776 / IFAM 1008 / 290) GN=Plim_0559 PE=4 SV=1: ACR_tran [Gemmata obscuriglobus UQM 2246]